MLPLQSLQSWHEPWRGWWYEHSCLLRCSPQPLALMFSDQYAFRPTGSTTAALVFLLQTITNLLAEQPYVVAIALDFSKAFDTVRHSTLLQKLATLDIPDTVYNWLVDYFSGHSLCTEFRGHISTFLNISASIVQGSAVGPVSYVVHAGDLTPLTLGNVFCKYAILSSQLLMLTLELVK